MPNEQRGFDWDELLEHIQEGRVIPIVGRDLVTIGGTPLEFTLAAKLAEKSRIADLPADRPVTLADVAVRFIRDGGDEAKLYSALGSLLREVAPPETAPPEPLCQLAAVRPFRLYVTTTFDKLLEEALRRTRGGIEPISLGYSRSGQPADIPRADDDTGPPVVYHILGSIKQQYAVSEEQVLNFLADLQAGNRPAYLFDALRDKYLLFLGCGFHDWLARFFIRVMKDHVRIRDPQFVADPRIHSDGNLVMYLKHYKWRLYHPGGAVDFVNELHQRWMQFAGQPSLPPDRDVPPMIPGAVFVSYWSGDRDAAVRIVAALQAAQIDVWFDKQELKGGDAYDRVIRRNIRQCSVFVPVVSRGAVAKRDSYFRREWKEACDRSGSTFGSDARVIIPVAIDDVPKKGEGIPDEFERLHWEKAPGGQVTRQTIDTILSEYRRSATAAR